MMAGLRTGYPGLTHTCKEIADFIGPSNIFCEPFAGLGRVSKHILAEEIYVNDKSEYATKELRKTFTNVSSYDFEEFVKKMDGPTTTFFFDPPWARKDYADNPKTFCDRGIGEYYADILGLCKTIKGRWFVAGRVSGGARSTVSVYFRDFPFIIIKSNRTINGHPIRTKIYYKK